MHSKDTLDSTGVIFLDKYTKRKIMAEKLKAPKKKGRPKKEVVKEETTEWYSTNTVCSFVGLVGGRYVKQKNSK